MEKQLTGETIFNENDISPPKTKLPSIDENQELLTGVTPKNENNNLSTLESFFKKLDEQRFRVEQRTVELQRLIQIEDQMAQKTKDDNEKYTDALEMLKSLNEKINGMDNIGSVESQHAETEVEECFNSIREMKNDINKRDREEEEETAQLNEKEVEYKEYSSRNLLQNEKEKLAASAFKELLQQLEDKKIRERRYNIMKNRNIGDIKKDANSKPKMKGNES